MSTEIQLLEPGKEQVDMFFDQVPIVTDWNEIREQVKSGAIASSNVLTKIKGYEPMTEHDMREHSHWVDQQVLRLALLHEANKPLELDIVCERCGTRKVDPVFDKSWYKICLPCAEEERQSPRQGSRGSCEYLQPCFNPRSKSWGLLYYWSHNRDDRFLFWLVDFYRTRQEAENAMRPIHYYHQWLDNRHHGMITHCLDFSRLLPLSIVMKLSLPMTPEQFTAHLRGIIAADMKEEQSVMAYAVSKAMEDHKSEERD